MNLIKHSLRIVITKFMKNTFTAEQQIVVLLNFEVRKRFWLFFAVPFVLKGYFLVSLYFLCIVNILFTVKK